MPVVYDRFIVKSFGSCRISRVLRRLSRQPLPESKIIRHMIDWSAVTAIGTLATGAIIAATVIVGFHQLRITRVQLEQLRRATQLDGAMKIFSDLNNAQYTHARRFVAVELPRRLQDPAFLKELELGIIWTENPDSNHEEQIVLRTFETIGSHVQRGLLDREVIVNMAAIPIIVSWEHLREVIQIQRRTIHPRMWENFEAIYNDAVAWFLERGGKTIFESWRADLIRHRASPESFL